MSLPERVPVQVLRLPHGEGLELPRYATAGAAGMDVLSAEEFVLEPGARHAVATGLALAIPPGSSTNSSAESTSIPAAPAVA